MTATDRVLAALADPTRRGIFDALVSDGEATATELAATRDVSRQAVAKHLQLLADVGLVAATKVGREQRFRATPGPLDGVVAWMVASGAAWDRRLERLQRKASQASTGRTSPTRR
jgi:DNA-binding transcriptional ArsR family regulator